MNFWSDTSTYDANGNVHSYLYEFRSSGQVISRWRFTYTYDAGGRLLSEISEEGLPPVNRWRSTYAYDAQGTRLSHLRQFWSYEGQWADEQRSTYTYDANGNRLSEITERYTYMTSREWVNSFRNTYTYDASGDTLSSLSEYWRDTQWVHDRRKSYTYDAEGNLTSLSLHTWFDSSWGPYNDVIAFTDNAGNDYFFFGYNVTLIPKVIVTSVTADSGTLPAEYVLEQNYPNPFNPATNVRFTICNLQFVSLRMYNTLGEQVAELVEKELVPGSYAIPWDAKDLPSGIYFYRLTAGEFTDLKKMVLLH